MPRSTSSLLTTMINTPQTRNRRAARSCTRGCAGAAAHYEDAGPDIRATRRTQAGSAIAPPHPPARCPPLVPAACALAESASPSLKEIQRNLWRLYPYPPSSDRPRGHRKPPRHRPEPSPHPRRRRAGGRCGRRRGLGIRSAPARHAHCRLQVDGGRRRWTTRTTRWGAGGLAAGEAGGGRMGEPSRRRRGVDRSRACGACLPACADRGCCGAPRPSADCR